MFWEAKGKLCRCVSRPARVRHEQACAIILGIGGDGGSTIVLIVIQEAPGPRDLMLQPLTHLVSDWAAGAKHRPVAEEGAAISEQPACRPGVGFLGPDQGRARALCREQPPPSGGPANGTLFRSRVLRAGAMKLLTSWLP